jgi:Ribonuclease G/E
MAAGAVVELALDRPGLLAGSRFVGRVTAVDQGLDGAFVDLGTPTPAFIKGAKAHKLSQGMAVGVVVRAEARGGKGPLLAHDPAIDITGAVPRLIERPSALARLLAAHPGVAEVVVDDPVALAEARALFPAAVLGEVDAVEGAFDTALAPVVDLSCGGRLVIEETAAVTAIDVDSGRAPPAEANRQAVTEIAGQLRLRNMGGQVVVDFVKGSRGTPHKMAAALAKTVALDPVPTRVAGVSPLGLVELVRQRQGLSLFALMGAKEMGPSAETIALHALRRLLAEDRAAPGRVLALRLPPAAAAALGRQDAALAEVARRLGRVPAVLADPACSDAIIEELRP